MKTLYIGVESIVSEVDKLIGPDIIKVSETSGGGMRELNEK